MKKLLFDIKPIEVKHSPSVKDSYDRYLPHLKQNKGRALGDRPSIIIDNGSYECRAGWSFEETPYLRFRNLVAKPKTTVNKAIDSMHLVGDELNEFDAGKLQKRSMFDKNIVYHMQSLEHMLDYTLGHLGLNNESSIEYPLLMTEPLCNPNYCRSNTSELLFECYRVSAVSYAVDSLLSFYYNAAKRDEDVFSAAHTSGLIISSSYSTSHVIPVLDGSVLYEGTKRLGLGGSQHFDFLGKSLNLKYAQHKTSLSQPDTIQYIMENHSKCATNYKEQIQFLEQQYNEERTYQLEEEEKKREALGYPSEESKVSKPVTPCSAVIYRNRIDRQNALLGEDDGIDRDDHTIQLPWTVEAAPTDEEIKKRHEMRKEQGQKLKEIMQRKREEKKRKMEEELVDLQSLESLREQNDNAGFKEEIQHRGLNSYDEYKKKVRLLQVKLNIRQAEVAKTDEEKFNLLDIADEFLSPEELKKKRIQKMQKTASVIREERKALLKQEREKIDELKSSDPDSYLKQLYAKRKEILDRITERSRRKEEFSKRGSKSAQKRLQMMAELGIGAENELKEKKRGRPPQDQGAADQDEGDTFGAMDEDWDVYRGIQKDGYSEDEEDDQQALNELEEQIADLDPKFANLMYNTSKQPTAEDYQIRLWSDRYRGAEILFQPSILGLESAGISEILENVLGSLSQTKKEQLLRFLHITGGHSMIPGFDTRIEAELRMISRAGTPINVVKAYDQQLDAWRGGAWLANTFFQKGGLQDFSISKAKYEECGHHYLKEHFCANIQYGMSKLPPGTCKPGTIPGELPNKRLRAA